MDVQVNCKRFFSVTNNGGVRQKTPSVKAIEEGCLQFENQAGRLKRIKRKWYFEIMKKGRTFG